MYVKIGGMAPRFTDEEVHTLKASLARLAPYGDALAEDLYRHLFAREPGIRHLFPASLDEQYYKLMRMIGIMVETVDRPEEFESELRTAGARHHAYGAAGTHYEAVGAALMAALRGSPAPPTAAEEALWLRLYAGAARQMIDED